MPQKIKTSSRNEIVAWADGRSNKIQEQDTFSRDSLEWSDKTQIDYFLFLSWLMFVFLDAAALVILAIGRSSSIGTSLSETIRRQLEPKATASFWMWLNRLAFGPHLGDADLDLMKHSCFWGQSNLSLSCNMLLGHTCCESLIWYKAMIESRNTAETFSGLASLYLIKDV